MTQYVGLDVSQKQTKLHVLDEAGNHGRCGDHITAVIVPLLQARQMARGKCAALDRRIIRSVQGDATCRTLMTMLGIGPITAVAYVPGSGLHRGASSREKWTTTATSRGAVIASCALCFTKLPLCL